MPERGFKATTEVELHQGFSALALLVLWAGYLPWGALCTAGCFAASLVSVHCMPVAPPTQPE